MATIGPSFLIGSSSFSQVMRTIIKSPKNLTYYLVATPAPSFLIGSSSFFQVTRTTIKSGQSSNLGHFGPRARELAALECIEKFP